MKKDKARTPITIFFAIMTLLVVGCAELHHLSPILAQSVENKYSNLVFVPNSAIQNIDSESTRLIIYRPQSLLGMMAKVEVVMDPHAGEEEIKTKQLPPRGYFVVDTRSDNFTLKLLQKGWDKPVGEHNLKLEKGMYYFFRMGLRPTHAFLKSVTVEEAKKDAVHELIYFGYRRVGMKKQ